MGGQETWTVLCRMMGVREKMDGNECMDMCISGSARCFPPISASREGAAIPPTGTVTPVRRGRVSCLLQHVEAASRTSGLPRGSGGRVGCCVSSMPHFQCAAQLMDTRGSCQAGDGPLADLVSVAATVVVLRFLREEVVTVRRWSGHRGGQRRGDPHQGHKGHQQCHGKGQLQETHTG